MGVSNPGKPQWKQGVDAVWTVQIEAVSSIVIFGNVMTRNCSKTPQLYVQEEAERRPGHGRSKEANSVCMHENTGNWLTKGFV